MGSIPASRTNFFKMNGSESDFWAIFLLPSHIPFPKRSRQENLLPSVQ
ncbi:MAG TPA: hypothetical protein VF797_16545 [Noviherbaspirillum sp.]